MTSTAILWAATPALPQSSATFQYDAAGRLTCVLYPSGSATSYTYDPANNRTRVVHSTGGCQTTGGGGPGDPPPGTVAITANQESVLESDGVDVAATFTITRSVSTTGTASVNWSVGQLAGWPHPVSIPQDFSGAVSGTVSFAANETTKQVTVLVAGDYDPENNEIFTVNLSAPVGVTIGLNQATAQTTIIDDDQGGVINTPPQAASDALDTPYQTPVTFDPTNNDWDPDFDPLTITAITQPSAGSATFTANSVTYTPPASFSGQVTFQYTVTDSKPNTTPSQGGIEITVLPAVPTIVAVDDQLPVISYYDPEANYWGTIGCADVLWNDQLPPSGATITAIGNASYSIGNAFAAGSQVCYEAPGYQSGHGSTFTYTIKDNASSATSIGTVTIIWTQ